MLRQQHTQKKCIPHTGKFCGAEIFAMFTIKFVPQIFNPSKKIVVVVLLRIRNYFHNRSAYTATTTFSPAKVSGI